MTRPNDLTYLMTPEQCAELDEAKARFLDAADTLATLIVPTLGEKRQGAINEVMAEGGTFCIEAARDAVGAVRVVATVVTAPGTRAEVVAIFVPDTPPSAPR